MQGSRGNQSLAIHRQSLKLSPTRRKVLTIGMEREELNRVDAHLPQSSRHDLLAIRHLRLILSCRSTGAPAARLPSRPRFRDDARADAPRYRLRAA